jgi:alanine racemase
MAATGERRAASVLAIDLAAMRDNYRRLRAAVGPWVACGAVVKADAYGLGARQVTKALRAEGCDIFFVALLDEGLGLRPHLPQSVTIVVLNGLPPGGTGECAAAGLVPVLNSLTQIEDWSSCVWRMGQALPAAWQMDSGMNRLGLIPCEVTRYRAERKRQAGINPTPASVNPMRPVVRLMTQMIQFREITAGDQVGYGWDFRADGTMRLATLSIGYAMACIVMLAARGCVMLRGYRLPIVGRVSMDSLMVDVTALPEGAVTPGITVDIIGDHQTVDDLAIGMNTIGYEVLTSLGHRFTRAYRDEVADSLSPQLTESLAS